MILKRYHTIKSAEVDENVRIQLRKLSILPEKSLLKLILLRCPKPSMSGRMKIRTEAFDCIANLENEEIRNNIEIRFPDHFGQENQTKTHCRNNRNVLLTLQWT